MTSCSIIITAITLFVLALLIIVRLALQRERQSGAVEDHA